MNGLFKHTAFPPKAMIPHLLAVVTGIDNRCILQQIQLLKGIQKNPDSLVQRGDCRVISDQYPSDHLRRGCLAFKISPQTAQRLIQRRVRLQHTGGKIRHQLLVVIPIFLFYIEWKVGIQISDVQIPRLCLSSIFLQPRDSQTRYLIIVIRSLFDANLFKPLLCIDPPDLFFPVIAAQIGCA